MANKFFVAPSPHVHSAQSTRSIMRDVLIAMLPALAVSTWVHGVDVLTVSAIAVVSCVVIEFLIQKFLFHGECTVSNLSAAVTGLLLAFNLPSSIPWWIVVIGSLVAIGVAKMTFGGLGRNPFNPALVGRVFLLIAYPVQMTTFTAPVVEGYADAMSGATPLAAIKAGVPVEDVDLLSMFSGTIPGSLGEVAAAALIVGGIFVHYARKLTNIPKTVLFSCVMLFSFLGSYVNNSSLFDVAVMFVFGLATKKAVNDRWVPVVCVLSPVICYILQSNSEAWFNGYQISFELLIINALVTVLGLCLLIKRK